MLPRLCGIKVQKHSYLHAYALNYLLSFYENTNSNCAQSAPFAHDMEKNRIGGRRYAVCLLHNAAI
jgi:hypothetical protein